MEVERGSFHWKDKDYADIEVKEKQEAVNTNGDVSHQKKYDFVKQFRLNDISFSIEKVRIKPSRSNPRRREKNQVEFLYSHLLWCLTIPASRNKKTCSYPNWMNEMVPSLVTQS